MTRQKSDREGQKNKGFEHKRPCSIYLCNARFTHRVPCIVYITDTVGVWLKPKSIMQLINPVLKHGAIGLNACHVDNESDYSPGIYAGDWKLFILSEGFQPLKHRLTRLKNLSILYRIMGLPCKERRTAPLTQRLYKKMGLPRTPCRTAPLTQRLYKKMGL
jgi:hypothetical protein